MSAEEKIQNETNSTKTGTVVKCQFLNIRKFPLETAQVVGIINRGEKLMLDMTKFSNDFYKVKTGSGTEGYCKKDFIEV